LLDHGLDALVANALAFLMAAQINFVLSLAFTWRDRLPAGSTFNRWLLFHGSIVFTALLNMLTFAAARPVVPTVLASVSGIAVGSLGNFFASDLFIFRGPRHHDSLPGEGTQAA
jgi:putative flippase GtrA